MRIVENFLAKSSSSSFGIVSMTIATTKELFSDVVVDGK